MRYLCFGLYFIAALLTNAPACARTAVAYYADPTITSQTPWHHQTVGFGLQAMLKQLLREKSPTIVLIDEKSLVGALQDHSPSVLSLSPQTDNASSLNSILGRYQLDSLYWVRIVDFLKPSSKFRVAIWSITSENTEITVELCRFYTSQSEPQCQSATAASNKTLNALLYQPIDTPSDPVTTFNQAEVGKLSHDALKKALSQFSD